MKNYQNIIHEEFMQKNTHVITLGIIGKMSMGMLLVGLLKYLRLVVRV
jgi:hypothetical protein